MTSPDFGGFSTTAEDTPRVAVSIFDILRRHVGAVIVCFVVAGIGCLGYRSFLKPSAISTASVVVENPRLDASGLGASDPLRYFASQLALARLPIVARDAIAKLPNSAALSVDDVIVTSDQVSDTIVITATLPEGQDDASVSLADAVLQSYVAISTSARKAQAAQNLVAVSATVDSLRFETSAAAISLRTQLTNRQIALRSESIAPVSLLIPSAAQLEPSGRPGITRVGLVLVLGGLWAGVAVAIGRDGVARRLTHAEDAARIAGLPVLATLTLQGQQPAAEAVWESLIPDEGQLNVLSLPNAFRRSRFDPAARQARRLQALLGRYAPSIRIISEVLRTEDLEALSRDRARVVIAAGPTSSQRDLQTIMAELSRIHLRAAGLVWSHPPAFATGAGRAGAAGLRRPAPRPHHTNQDAAR